MPLQRRRQRLIFEALEPRVLLAADELSAALGAVAGSVPTSAVLQEPLTYATEHRTTSESADQGLQAVELVVIDAAINPEDRAALLADVQDQIRADRDVQVVQLDAQRDPIAQISFALAQKVAPVSAVHLFSHGDAGSLMLGGMRLDADTISAYQTSLQSWQTMLADDADLLIYGCDVAAGVSGRAMLHSLATWTGADVAASDDATGAAVDEADWEFEVLTGPIETPVVVSDIAQQQWLQPLQVEPSVGPGPQLVNTASSVQQNLGSTSRGSQRAVALAENGTGVVVWTEGPATGATSVWARRIHADGSFNGAAFRIDNGSYSVNEHVSVSMVPNTNGNKFLAVWEVDQQTSRNDAGVRGRIWDLSATSQAGLLQFNGTTTGSQRNPSFAIDDNGKFVVAWETVGRSRDSDNGIFARRFNADGSTNGAEFTVAANTASLAYSNPTVASATDGAFAIAYDRSGTGSRLELNVYNTSGVKTNTTPIVVDTYAGTDGLGHEPAMVARQDGSYALGWTSAMHDQVKRAVYSASGTALHVAQTVWGGGNTNRLHSVSVAAASSNDYVLTFSQTFDSGTSDVYAQVYTAAGAQAENFTVNQGSTTGNQTNPSIAMPDRDMVIGVWDGAGAADANGVYLARLGSSVDAPVIQAPAALTGGRFVTSLAEGPTSGTSWQFTTSAVTGPATTISWSLVTGLSDDRAQFSINTSTGLLTLNANSDFESPADQGANNQYSVTLRATDNWGNRSDLPVRVTITDVASQAWVNTTADTNDAGVVAGNPLHTIEWLNIVGRASGDRAISLREALIAANNAPASVAAANNRIAFKLPDGADADSLPDAITLTSALPQIARPVQIDGLLTLPDGASMQTTNLASPATDSSYQAPHVVLASSVLTGRTTGVFDLVEGADGSLIRGLSIHDANGIGVLARGADQLDLRNNEFINVTTPVAIGAGYPIVVNGTTPAPARDASLVSEDVSVRLSRFFGIDGPLVDYVDQRGLDKFEVLDGLWRDAGTTANHGMDSPVVERATRVSPSQVSIQGYVGLGATNTQNYAGAQIDLYQLTYDPSWVVVDATYLATATVGANGAFTALVDWDDEPGELQMVTALATFNGNTSEFANLIPEVLAAPILSLPVADDRLLSGAENAAIALPVITLSDVNLDTDLADTDPWNRFTLRLQASLGSASEPMGRFEFDEALAEDVGVSFERDDAGGLTLIGGLDGLDVVWTTLQFQAPAYFNGSGQIAITATDGQDLTSTPFVLDVTVTQVAQAPTFAQSSYAVTMLEHGAAVRTFTATDPDAQGLRYSLVTSASLPDAELFDIDQNTGALRFKPQAVPDVDTPADQGRDNIYNLQVRVTDDDGEVATADVSVRVLANILWVTSVADTVRDGGEAMTVAELAADPAGGITLREALLAANNTPGLDRIYFDLPGATPATLAVSGAALPAITSPVILDGTQGRVLLEPADPTDVSGPFWLPQLRTGMVDTVGEVPGLAPIVRVDGGWSPGTGLPVADDSLGRNGLTLGTGSEGSTVRGLQLQHFDGSAVQVLSDGNLIAGNLITANRLNGVRVAGPSNAASGNRILSNTLYGNGLMGIDLYAGTAGVDPNDDALTPGQANQGVDHPVITSNLLRMASGRLMLDVAGRIGETGTASFAGARLEFYAVDPADLEPHGEGRWFLGAITLPVDSVGSDFSGTLDLGLTGLTLPAWTSSTRITATVTHPTAGTSEFAANVAVRTPPLILGPNTVTGQEDAASIAITGLQINDLAADLDQVVITVSAGVLQLSGGSDPLVVQSQAQGDGWRLTLSAPSLRSEPDALYQQAINTALAGLSYRPASHAHGAVSVTVTARDRQGEIALPVSQTITINAVNDPARITSAEGAATVAVAVMETLRDVATLSWRDDDQADAGFVAPGWTLLATGDYQRFEMDNNGQLRFKADAIPDFETWRDAGSTPFVVTVGLVDAGAASADNPTAQQTYRISLVNAADTLVVRRTDDSIARAEPIRAGNLLHTVEWLNARYADSVTLREALIAANNTAGIDTIRVDFSALAPGSVPVIRLATALPAITDAVDLDGRHPLSAPDASLTERLLVDGTGLLPASPVDGLTLSRDAARGSSSERSTIRGLGLSGFSGVGLRVLTDNNIIADNLIGATSLADGLSGNAGGGLVFAAGASSNHLGGTTAADGNLIVGNGGDGVLITGAGTDSNIVANNRIEVADNAALGAGEDVWAIRLSDGASGNLIGAMPLDWEQITGPMGNQIIGGRYGGIRVEGGAVGTQPAVDTRISGNTISSTGGLAIDLGEVGLSAETGEGRDGRVNLDRANRGVDRPVLDQVNQLASGVVQVRGHVGLAGATGISPFVGASVDVYQSAGAAGAAGQLLRHLGRVAVNADGTFALEVPASLAATLGAQGVVSAVMILDVWLGPLWLTGNTSEAAPNVVVNQAPAMQFTWPSAAFSEGQTIPLASLGFADPNNNVRTITLRVTQGRLDLPLSDLGWTADGVDMDPTPARQWISLQAPGTPQPDQAWLLERLRAIRWFPEPEFEGALHLTGEIVDDGGLSTPIDHLLPRQALSDAPQITGPNAATGEAVQAIQVVENTATTEVLARFTATDPDTNAQWSWWLPANRGDNVRFSIDTATGELRFAVSPDAEEVAAVVAAEAPRQFTVVVQVRDDTGLTAERTLQVTVTDEDDNPLIVTHRANGATGPVVGTLVGAVSELAAADSSVGIQLTGQDRDVTARISYSLTDDAQGRFWMDDQGVVRLTSTGAESLDFEDAAHRSFDLIARIQSGGRWQDVPLRVSLVDDNEHPVQGLHDADAADNAWLEGSPVGSGVGLTAQATDADGSNNTIRYRLSINPQEAFGIDETTGVVTVVKPQLLDFEQGTTRYRIEVTAESSDGSSQRQGFDITLLDRFEPSAARAVDLNVDTQEDQPLEVDLVALLAQAGISRVALTSDMAARSGSVSLTAQGRLLYTPAADFHGVDIVSYTVRTPEGSQASAVLTVQVASVNDLPKALPAPPTAVRAGEALTLAARHFPMTDLEGDPLQIEIAALPSLGQVFLNGVPMVVGQRVSLTALQFGPMAYVAPAALFSQAETRLTYRVGDLGTPDGAFASGTLSLPITVLPLLGGDFGGLNVPSPAASSGTESTSTGGALPTLGGQTNRGSTSSTRTREAEASTDAALAPIPALAPNAGSGTHPTSKSGAPSRGDGAEGVLNVAASGAAGAIETAHFQITNVAAELSIGKVLAAAGQIAVQGKSDQDAGQATQGVMAGMGIQLNLLGAQLHTGLLQSQLWAPTKIDAQKTETQNNRSSSGVSYRSEINYRQFDQLRQQVSEKAASTRINSVVSSVAVSGGMSVGYVIWLLRGGVLASTMLSSLPAWRTIDPLPVLSRSGSADVDDEGDSLESLVSTNGEDGEQPDRDDVDTALQPGPWMTPAAAGAPYAVGRAH